MPSIPQILKHGKKWKSQSQVPPNLGSAQSSSSTVGSHNISSGWNSSASSGSRGTPEREPIQRVPENAADYHVPAELDARGNSPWVSVPLTPQQPQPRYYQQYGQHLQQQPVHQLNQPPPQQPQPHQQRQQPVLITDEETLNRARRVNELIAQRNEERRILERRRNASADNVRKLRELIRERYALDLYVWGKRNVPKASRWRIEPKCKKADALLQEIHFIVGEWDEDLFDKDEWQIVKRIKAGLSMKQQENGEPGEPAIWDDLAPWDRRDDLE